MTSPLIEAGAIAIEHGLHELGFGLQEGDAELLMQAALKAISESGPTPEMIAAALPLSDDDILPGDMELGASACLLLSGGHPVFNEGEAVVAAAQLVRDFRAMLSALPDTGGE